MTTFHIHIYPRDVVTWEQFCYHKQNAIALDGFVVGGPNWDPQKKLVNFDHHDGVVREATMSTAKQVYFAIKGGFCSWMGQDCDVYVNDIDQDTAMAIWLLKNHRLFEGTGSVPNISRILELNDRLDITGGAFPMSLADTTYGQHCWVFEPYSSARTSGLVSRATASDMRTILDACCARLTAVMMGQGESILPKVKTNILYNSAKLTMLDETEGGIESRHLAFANGDVGGIYLSIVANRPDGRTVYTLGKVSRYVDFDLRKAFDGLNDLEGFTAPHGWGGSDLIGGSDRATGSGLHYKNVLTHLVLWWPTQSTPPVL